MTNRTSESDKLTPHKGTLKYRMHLKDDPCYSNVTTLVLSPHNGRLVAFQEPIVWPVRQIRGHVGDMSGRPRNRCQDEVRKDGRLVEGIGWKERVHNREEWKNLLRTARSRRLLHMPMNE